MWSIALGVEIDGAVAEVQLREGHIARVTRERIVNEVLLRSVAARGVRTEARDATNPSPPAACTPWPTDPSDLRLSYEAGSPR